MSRFRLIVLAVVAAAVAASSWGIAPARAEDDAGAVRLTQERAGLAKKLAEADAAQARALKDAAWQRRKQMREFVQQVIRGQQPPGAPAGQGQGGAK